MSAETSILKTLMLPHNFGRLNPTELLPQFEELKRFVHALPKYSFDDGIYTGFGYTNPRFIDTKVNYAHLGHKYRPESITQEYSDFAGRYIIKTGLSDHHIFSDLVIYINGIVDHIHILSEANRPLNKKDWVPFQKIEISLPQSDELSSEALDKICEDIGLSFGFGQMDNHIVGQIGKIRFNLANVAETVLDKENIWNSLTGKGQGNPFIFPVSVEIDNY